MRGATVETSLLEKGRVVRHSAGERSFHALHGLAAACDALQPGAAGWALSWLKGASSSEDAQLATLKLRRADLPGRGRLAYLQAAEHERDAPPHRKSQSAASSRDVDAGAAEEQQPEAIRR